MFSIRVLAIPHSADWGVGGIWVNVIKIWTFQALFSPGLSFSPVLLIFVYPLLHSSSCCGFWEFFFSIFYPHFIVNYLLHSCSFSCSFILVILLVWLLLAILEEELPRSPFNSLHFCDWKPFCFYEIYDNRYERSILAHLCLLSTIRLQVIPLCFSEVFILSDCATTLLQNWANVCQGKQAVHWFYSDFLFCHLKSIQLPKAQLVSLF